MQFQGQNDVPLLRNCNDWSELCMANIDKSLGISIVYLQTIFRFSIVADHQENI
jgi:hypothetical protein